MLVAALLFALAFDRVTTTVTGVPTVVEGYALQTAALVPVPAECCCAEDGGAFPCVTYERAGWEVAWYVPDPGVGTEVMVPEESWTLPPPSLGGVTLVRVCSVRGGMTYCGGEP